MIRRKNIEGKQFNRLKVLKFSHINKRNNAVWECLCDCGNIIHLSTWHLTSGNTKSCGCYNREMHSKLIATNKIWDINRRYWTPVLLDDATIKIPLDNGEFSLIDKEDLNKTKDIFWMVNNRGYVAGKHNNKSILLHRLITGFKAGVVHHKNKNKKDNRKSNLEVMPKNIHDKLPKGTSDTVGIRKRKDTGKYTIRKYIMGKREYLGQADTIEEAIRIFNSI